MSGRLKCCTAQIISTMYARRKAVISGLGMNFLFILHSASSAFNFNCVKTYATAVATDWESGDSS